MKPQKLGHEAHCPAFNWEMAECECLYPELERLWEAEKTLKEENAELKRRMDVVLYAGPSTSLSTAVFDRAERYERVIGLIARNGMDWSRGWIVQQCKNVLEGSLRQDVPPDQKPVGEMITCECGNKYSRDFLKMDTIPCFNCGTLVKATI